MKPSEKADLGASRHLTRPKATAAVLAIHHSRGRLKAFPEVKLGTVLATASHAFEAQEKALQKFNSF